VSAATAPSYLPDGLVGAWALLAQYPLLLAVTIMLSAVLLAVILRAVLMRWVERVLKLATGQSDMALLRVVANAAAGTVLFLGGLLAVQSLALPAGLETVSMRVLSSLLVLFLMRAAMRATHAGLVVVGRLRERFPIVEERTIPLFDLIATVIIVGIAAYALLMVWDIDATAWLASAGVVGIAVGFAARDTLANLFAGFFIIADSPYKLGDYVVLDNGARGEVVKVGIRSTRILTRDDVEVTVPNSEMANSKVINESGGRWVKFRIRIQVGVAYGSDVDAVVALLEQVAADQPAVCDDPAPRVRMRGFGDSSLNFELLCWVDHPSERGLVSHHLYMGITKALAAANIEIPFPQRDLWLRNAPTLSEPPK